MTESRLRIGFIGAGSIVPTHLAALDRLPQANVVSICSRNAMHAELAAGGRRLTVYTDADLMLSRERLDAVFVCLPPHLAPSVCSSLATRGIPFLVEKPVAALDSALASKVADDVEGRELVTAVGYHLRGLDFLPEVRVRVRERTPDLVIARWLQATPQSSWWGRSQLSGGQVIEQMTHLYDLARTVLGEGIVVAASSSRATQEDDSVDFPGSVTAIVRFESGAIGPFTNSRYALSSVVELELISIGLQTTIRFDPKHSEWLLTLIDGRSSLHINVRRNPYVVQAEAFLAAVAEGDPTRVLASYREGLATYLLTRSVAAVAGGQA